MSIDILHVVLIAFALSFLFGWYCEKKLSDELMEGWRIAQDGWRDALQAHSDTISFCFGRGVVTNERTYYADNDGQLQEVTRND
jgi:hypothetical protein